MSNTLPLKAHRYHHKKYFTTRGTVGGFRSASPRLNRLRIQRGKLEAVGKKFVTSNL